VEAEVVKIGARLGELRGAIFRAGEPVAEGRMRFAIAEAAEILGKSEVRRQEAGGRKAGAGVWELGTRDRRLGHL
jgi:hypothetical protein